uniref:GDSL-like Lipase/Acylhydrolase family n=1 Tax=Candidatus Kentrum sp. UNK TaxID=2126344 RepID=A0A451AJX3_9GAMM|nr:MAG: GDSL-like Lipase/Acylhydrolase family [Candidatus Kentron sp. UNK]VFK71947.1 MAG: GDSL-like Lipase/Acylhydrolase family [Candidatus Kentron sp. UNK]
MNVFLKQVLLALTGVALILPICGRDTNAEMVDTPTLEWKVAQRDRFRMFLNPKAFDIFQVRYDELNDSEKSDSPVSSMEKDLVTVRPNWSWASIFFNSDKLGGKSLRENICLFSKDESSGVSNPECREGIQPKSYLIKVQIKGGVSGICSWHKSGKLQPVCDKAESDCKKPVDESDCSKPVFLNITREENEAKAEGAQHGVEVSVKIPSKSGPSTLTTYIHVDDKFILGLGDSFASGEGNPDVPMRYKSKLDSKDWAIRADHRKAEGSLWMDRACHRSFYSPQFRAALTLALSDKKRSIMYVGLACSGAEIAKGMFTKYYGVEGLKEGRENYSQLSTALRILCDGKIGSPENQKDNDLPTCEGKLIRSPDKVLLSIGGNDVRFSGLIAHAILEKGTMRSLANLLNVIATPEEATKKIHELSKLYSRLNTHLDKTLMVSKKKIYLTPYPRPLFDETGKLCQDTPMGKGPSSPFRYAADRASKFDHLEDKDKVIPKLLEAMRTAAETHKWHYVGKISDEFLNHGWCAKASNDVTLPERGLKIPQNPSDHRPYQSRQRWLWTIIDAYMNVNYKWKGYHALSKKVAAYTSGSFHPTAEGAAHMADHIYRSVEDTWLELD